MLLNRRGLWLLWGIAFVAMMLGASWSLQAQQTHEIYGSIWNNGQNTGGQKDQDGNRLWVRETFDEVAPVKTNGLYVTLPAGWSSKSVMSSASGNNIKFGVKYGLRENNEGQFTLLPAEYRLLPNGKRAETINGQAIAVFFASEDTQAISELHSPGVDLSDKNANYFLSFKYGQASSGNNVDWLEVYIQDGPKNEPRALVGTVKTTDYFFTRKIFPLKKAIEKLLKEGAKANNIVLVFQAHANSGYGIGIDDIEISDASANPIDVLEPTFSQTDGPVGAGTLRNQAATLDVTVKPGEGSAHITTLEFKFIGEKVENVENAYLYRSVEQAFNPDDKYKIADLVRSGKSFALPSSVSDITLDAGLNRFFLVIDVKAGSEDLKNTISFIIDESKLQISLFQSNGQQLGTNPTRPVTPTVYGDMGPNRTRLTIYKTLVNETFEGTATSSDWELVAATNNPWIIGEMADNNTVYDQTKLVSPYYPVKAFSGEKMLGTGELLPPPSDKMIPRHARGINQASIVLKSFNGKEINPSYYKNLKLFLRDYFLLSENDELVMEVSTDNYEPSDPNKVWTRLIRYVNDQEQRLWSLKQFALDRADRSGRLMLRFRFSSSNATNTTEQKAGYFVDDLVVLGDYIRHDVNIISVSKPVTFTYSEATEFEVTVRNDGAEDIAGDIPLRFALNGQTLSSVQIKQDGATNFVAGSSLTGGLKAGETKVLRIKGIPITPDPLRSNLRSLQVTARFDKDDYSGNDSYTSTFFAFPIFEVTDSKVYPPVGDKLEQWFGESQDEYPSTWVRDLISRLAKSTRGQAPYGVSIPYNKDYIWTTGSETDHAGERSTLTGPVLSITGAEPKEILVAYALSPETKLRVEYSTDDAQSWQVLNALDGKSQNWYSNTDQSWSVAASMPGYQVARTVLPDSWNNQTVQLRFVYEGGSTASPGAAINGVLVRALRPDLAIDTVDYTPVAKCDDDFRGQSLKVYIHNKGSLTSRAMDLPISAFVYRKTDLNAIESAPIDTRFYSLSIPDIAPGEKYELDTELVYDWSASPFGYRIDLSINPEGSSIKQLDGDPSNNEAKLLVYTLPRETPLIFVENNSSSEPALFPKPAPSSASNNLDLYVSTTKTYWAKPIEELGWVKYSYKSKAPYWSVATPPWQIPRVVETKHHTYDATPSDEAKKAGYRLVSTSGACQITKTYLISPTSVQLRVALGRTFSLSTCSAPAEDIPVVVSQLAPSNYKGQFSVKAYLDDNLVGELTNQTMPASGDLSLTIPKVPIPTGDSHLLIFVETAGGNLYTKGSFVDVNLSRVNEDDFLPQNVHLFETNLKAAKSRILTREPAGGSYEGEFVFRNYGQSRLVLTTSIASAKNLIFDWYKGGDSKPIIEANPEFDPIGLESGLYSLRYRSKPGLPGCQVPERTIDKIRLLTGDVQVMGFADLASGALCANEDGSANLKIRLKNNGSSATIRKGSKVQYSVAFATSAALMNYADISGETTLENDIAPGTEQIAQITLPKGKVDAAHTDYFVQFRLNTINGNTDGEVANNETERLPINVYMPPTITWQKPVEGNRILEIKKVYDENSSTTLAIDSQGQPVSWESHDFQEDWTMLLDDAGDPLKSSELVISGIPAEYYRVTVQDGNGCRQVAELELIQNDLKLNDILTPKSECQFGAESRSVSLSISNVGSKPLKAGTRIKALVTLQKGSDPEVVTPMEIVLAETLRAKTSNQTVYADLVQGDPQSVRNPVDIIKTAFDGQGSKGGAFSFKVDLSLVNLKEVSEDDNSATSQIQQYGRPQFDLAVLDKNTASDPDPSIGNNGYLRTIGDNILSFQSRTLRIDNLDQGATPFITWYFEGDQGSIVFAAGNELLQVPSMPNEDVRKQTDKKDGTGIYTITVSTNGGLCVEKNVYSLKFLSPSLQPSFVNLPIGGISACEFTPEQSKLSIAIKNNGTLDIPGGSVLELTWIPRVSSFTAAESAPVTKNVKTKQIILENTLHANSTVNFKDISGFDFMGENNEFDNKDITLKFKVEIQDQNIQDLIGKDMESETITIVNKPDAKIEPLFGQTYNDFGTVTGFKEFSLVKKPGSPNEYETFVYDRDPTRSGSLNGNAKISFADAPDHEYKWTLNGPELYKGYGTDKPELDTFGKVIALHLVGSGSINITAKNNVGCLVTKRVPIASNIFDLKIKLTALKDQVNAYCFEENRTAKVRVTVANLSTKHSAEINTSTAAASKIKVSLQLQDASGALVPGSEKEQVFSLADLQQNLGWAESGPDLLVFPGEASFDFEESFEVPAKGEYTVVATMALEHFGEEDANNNESTTTFEFFGPPTLQDPLPLTDLRFFQDFAQLAVSTTDEAAYDNFVWERESADGTFKKVTDPMGRPTKSAIQASQPGVYRVSFMDQNGCAGQADYGRVRFPGYLQLVDGTLDLVKPQNKRCGLTNSEDLVVSVKNAGREYLSINLPITLTIARSVNGNRTDQDLQFEPSQNVTLAPGETVELTSQSGVDLHEQEVYSLSAAIKHAQDHSRDNTLSQDLQWPILTEIRDVSVEHRAPLADPDLSSQVGRALREYELDPTNGVAAKSLHLWSLPRQFVSTSQPFTVSLDAGKNVGQPDLLGGATYSWSGGDPTNSGVRDERDFTITQDGTYSVTVVSAWGCETTSEVTVEYQKDYRLNLTFVAPNSLGTGGCLPAGQQFPLEQAIEGHLSQEDMGTPALQGTLTPTYKDDPFDASSSSIPQKFNAWYEIEEDGTVVVSRADSEQELTLTQELAPGTGTQTIAFTGQYAKFAFQENRKYHITMGMSLKDRYGRTNEPKNDEADRTYDVIARQSPSFDLEKPTAPIDQPSEVRISNLKPADARIWFDDQFQPAGARVFTVNDTKNYTLKVSLGDKTCAVVQNISVQRRYQINWSVSGEGGKVSVTELDSKGNPKGNPLTTGARVISPSKVRASFTARDGYKIDQLIVNGEEVSLTDDQKTAYEFTRPVTEDISVVAVFSEDNEQGVSTPVTDSRLLRVTPISPFDTRLILLETEHVESYEVYNQVGQKVLHGQNLGQDSRIAIPTDWLSDGLYLVRVRTHDGATRTLRAMRMQR